MTKREKQLTKEVANLNDKNHTLNNKIKVLEEQLAQLRRDKFGQKREKMPENPDELLDWDGELDKLDRIDEDEVVEIDVKSSKRKKRKKQDYAAFLRGLRREKIIHDLPEEEKKGLVCIAEDEFERLAYTPPEYYVKVHVVRKYAVQGHSSSGVIVPDDLSRQSQERSLMKAFTLNFLLGNLPTTCRFIALKVFLTAKVFRSNDKRCLKQF